MEKGKNDETKASQDDRKTQKQRRENKFRWKFVSILFGADGIKGFQNGRKTFEKKALNSVLNDPKRIGRH